MTTKEFLEKYNYAPYSEEDVAELAEKIEDNIDLANIAREYLEKLGLFRDALEDIGFEFG